MNSNVANFLWVNNALSLYENKCIESFVRNGFQVNVYSYETIEVPDGATLKDARVILPESSVYSYTQAGKKGNLAAFSDAFRYELCKKRAGWWFDTDVFCLKDVKEWQELAERNTEKVVVGWESGSLINGAVILSDSVLFDEKIAQHLHTIGKEFPWGEIGPRLITKVVDELGMYDSVVSESYFYPINFNEFSKLFDPEENEYCQSKIENSYCVHLWNEFFTRSKIPKNVAPPNNGFLYKLLSKYTPLDSKTALPLETLKVLCELRNINELRDYKNNMERKALIKMYRKLRNYI